MSERASLFQFLHWPLVVVKIAALLFALCVLCAIFAGALYVFLTLARKYPWSALGAVPMVAAYAWAIWGHTPGYGWRIGIAVAIQAVTLLTARVVAG